MLGSARPVTPGSASYTIPGTFSFVVPEYYTLTIDLSGAGGGGAARNYTAASGAPTQITSLGLIAGGGGGSYNVSPGVNAPGVSGSASGGDTNITGGGAAGGAAGLLGQPGGPGGRCVKTYTYGAPGAPVPGALLTISVGSGGAGAGSGGGAGGNGNAALSWN